MAYTIKSVGHGIVQESPIAQYVARPGVCREQISIHFTSREIVILHHIALQLLYKQRVSGFLVGSHEPGHLQALTVSEHDKTVYEIRTCLQCQRSLIRLEHKCKVHSVAVLAQHERKLVATVEVLRASLVVTLAEALVSGHELTNVLRIDRSRVRNFYDDAVW